MALTSSTLGNGSTRGDMGAFYAEVVTFTCDASYPTGGYALPGLDFQTILGMTQAGSNTAGNGYIAIYNTQTGKFQMFQDPSTAATSTVVIAGSATAASDTLSYYPVTGNAGVLGTTAAVASQTIAASTFGIILPGSIKLGEVPNGTSLTGVTVTMLVFGY